MPHALRTGCRFNSREGHLLRAGFSIHESQPEMQRVAQVSKVLWAEHASSLWAEGVLISIAV